MPFDIIFPICVITLIGFLAGFTGLVKPQASDAIADLVFKLIIPILLFRMVAKADVAALDAWSIWGTYFGAILPIWFLVSILLPSIYKRESQWGTIGAVSATFANTVLIGIPIVALAIGDEGLVALSILLSVHLPVLLIITTLQNEGLNAFGAGHVASASQTPLLIICTNIVRSIALNPILIGIFAGVAFNLSGLPWVNILEAITAPIGDAGGGLALLVLGLGLQKLGIAGDIKPAILVTVLKLGLMPFLVYLLGTYVFALPPYQLATFILVSACPSGVNSFIFATQFKTGERLAANAITISMVASLLTLSAWLLFVQVYILR